MNANAFFMLRLSEKLNIRNWMLFAIMGLLIQVSGMAFADFAIKATPAGTPNSLTLSVNIQPDQSIYGQPGSFFVAAKLPNNIWYYPTPTGWTVWNRANPLPPYITTIVQATNNFTPIWNMDTTNYGGATIYAGYGSSMASMMNSGTWNSVYVVPNSAPFTSFYVWASTGPLAYLSGATVTIKNASGTVIGSATTNRRGIVQFNLPSAAVAQFPLQIVASGGQANGQSFRGTLRAEASTVGIRTSTPIVYLDLISTSAKVLADNGYAYADAVKAVRASLGIGSRQAIDILRVKNNQVDNTKLLRAVLKSGGFDSYTKIVANAAAAGKPITGLQPSRWSPGYPVNAQQSVVFRSAPNQSQAVSAQAATASSTSSSASSICTTQPSNGSSTSASQTIVTDFGEIATSVLLQYVGLPKAAASGITGMLFGFIPSGTSQTTQALTNIANELDCISTQLAAINDEIEELQFTADLTSATACQDAIQPQWTLYQGLVNDNIDTPSAINSTNPNVLTDVYNFNAVNTSCGSSINNSLFGTQGNPGAAAWPALNTTLYQPNYSWYTQLQTQPLQSFLSYWSTMLYQQFVLINEYYNYYGEFTNAQSLSGAAADGSSGCAQGTTSNSATFCAQQANIQNAFPGDLYSDEIGLYQSGLAVNAYPAGQAVGQGSLGFNAYYLGTQIWFGQTTPPSNWSYPASALSQTAINAFNGNGINPSNMPSAIETFTNPQALRTTSVPSTNVAALTSSQPANSLTAAASWGTSMNDFYLWAINQAPGSWQALNNSQIGFYTSDNVTTQTSQASATTLYNTTIHFGNFNGSWNTTVVCWPGLGCTPPGTPPVSGYQYPIMGVLLGRTWWPAAPNAATYNYSTLPNPLIVPSAPTLIGATPGISQITVAFTGSTYAGSSPITGYLASCTTSAGVTTTSTGGASATSVTVTGLTGGTSYSCSVQAQNGGLSAPSNSASATPSSPPVTVPGAPTLTGAYFYPSSVTGSANGGVLLDFNGSTNTGNAPITSYQGTCTNAGGSFTGTNTPGYPVVVTTPPSDTQPYSCYVQAQNSAGLGAASNTLTTITEN